MIIAIGGVSTAGKTTLATRLRDAFTGQRISLLCQDDFVHDVALIPKIHERVDWEHPDSIHHEKMLQAIIAEKAQNDIVIVEGLMVFWHQETVRLFDKSIYIEIPQQLFRTRKAADNRWGNEPEWYIDHIWNSFQQYGIPQNKTHMLLLNGQHPIPMKKVIQYLKA